MLLRPDFGCADDEDDAVEQCGDIAGDLMIPQMGYEEFEPQTMACGGLEADDCGSWSPSSAVAQDPTSGVYEVDETFASALIADPAPLIDCDAGRWTFINPGFELSGASTGELMRELGFLNGDVVTSLNGYSLDSAADVVEAFTELLGDGETEFTIGVNRPGIGSITLDFEIVP